MKTKRKPRFLTVGQAAEVLSVAANTVRAWGAAGKLAEYRHPINRYRLYKLADVERLRNMIEEPATDAISRKKRHPRSPK